MQVRVELYGIPRLRAGQNLLAVEIPGGTVTLGDVFAQLAHVSPELAASCFPGGQLNPECAVSIDGAYFTRDAATVLFAGQTLLLMSADVGG